MAKPVISVTIAGMINNAINTGTFPDALKKADVTPVFKKAHQLSKENYRPVSILPCLSKVYEKVLAIQLGEYFENIFDQALSAFRAGYSSQDTLLSLVEKWKMPLREHKHAGAILMDLSKAFDCMPHGLLLAKLEAYGLSGNSIKIMRSYLTGRKQRVKIGNGTSDWTDILKGVPQGSILGPILLHIFLNDMFKFIRKAELVNYADDNTINAIESSQQLVVQTLQIESKAAIDWFTLNEMLANPHKFQAIFLASADMEFKFEIDDITLIAEDYVKLLGVNLDKNLNYDTHIKQICKKAGNHLNALKRLSPYISINHRMAIFRCFILCHFQFCSIVWHFCGVGNTKKMEKIQERGLRFVYGDYTSDYDSLLCKSKMPSLKLGRERNIAIHTYKIKNNLAPRYLKELITPIQNSKFHLPLFKSTRHGLNSFAYMAPRIWNTLPECTRNATSLQNFKSRINKWSGIHRSQHKCANCIK